VDIKLVSLSEILRSALFKLRKFQQQRIAEFSSRRMTKSGGAKSMKLLTNEVTVNLIVFKKKEPN
jgi:hypothetical protein